MAGKIQEVLEELIFQDRTEQEKAEPPEDTRATPCRETRPGDRKTVHHGK